MLEAPDLISNLIARHITGQLSSEETMQLEEWLESAAHHRTMFNRIIDPANRTAAWDLINQVNPDRTWELLRKQVPGLPVSYAPPARRKYIPLLRWAAIIVVLVTGVALWKLIRVEKKTDTQQPITVTVPDNVGTAVALTLGNDSSILVKNKDTGFIASEGPVNIFKKNDTLVYQAEVIKGVPATPSFNTLQTPVGEMYGLKLSDGTRVWLSVHSRLRYPAMFQGDQRLVELSGEAYFEVKRKKEPFVVKTPLTANIVHGTTFIVKAYPGEVSAVTTVISGSVTVKRGKDSVVLGNGQQALVTKNSFLQAVNINQPADVAAWQRGYKKFTQATLAEILPSIEYWHGYTAEGPSPARRSTGTLNLKDEIVPLSRTLERIFGVHIKVDTVHRKLIITP